MTDLDKPVDYWPVDNRPRRGLTAARLRRIDNVCVFCAGMAGALLLAVTLGRHMYIVTGGPHPASFSPAAVLPGWLAWLAAGVTAGLLVLSFAVLEPAIRRARRHETGTEAAS